MPQFKYVREAWMNAVPRRDQLSEEDKLLLSTLDSVAPVDSVIRSGMSVERVFSEWLDAGKKLGLVTGGEAARLWKSYAAGEA